MQIFSCSNIRILHI